MNSVRPGFLVQAAVLVIVCGSIYVGVSGLGSMSSIAVSYGENGPVFCGLSSDGSHMVSCFGADASIVYGAPIRLPLLGLTAGDGFVCGLLLDAHQPYCWGSNIYVKMGVPQPMVEGAAYSEISAGDDHLCALRRPSKGEQRGASLIDCWGYNMTASHEFSGPIVSITAGSVFNCGMFAGNRTAFCWGDETGSSVISLTPKNLRFRSISAGGFHVCGVLQNSQVFCWGRNLEMQQSSSDILGQGDVNMVPMDPMVSVAGGRFHACGIKSLDRKVVCWGFKLQNSVPPPKDSRVYELAAGDYFTCGVIAEASLRPQCWGTGGPWSIPMAVSPGICASNPCGPGYYQFIHASLGGNVCKQANSRVCLPCSAGCPEGTYQSTPCNSTSDRGCGFNCSSCASADCSSSCSSEHKPRSHGLLSLQMPVFVAELAFAIVFASSVSLVACLCVRRRLRSCSCSEPDLTATKTRAYSFHKEPLKFEEGNIVEWGVPLIKAGDVSAILDPALKPPAEPEALKKIAATACKCVRMRAKDRPSMDKVTTALERALALLMGSPCNEQPILPTEVVLGSSRLHKRGSQRSSNQSCSETDTGDADEQLLEYRAPSWITFPSVTSSQRRSEGDATEGKNSEGRSLGNGGAGDGLRCLEEEIGPASPQQDLFLQHNF
ncbi:hypothetical protein OPV22_031333 [Ensete ventricosum]|uniref:non-specific serine/threonine protein kinase n=1 Tax=Ensete ventricosum TaxID=4639 RepID=A0AAV8PSG8_ENSVE|nr:hypothetical protein OPV22_031333 [Ensete ventricosum]